MKSRVGPPATQSRQSSHRRLRRAGQRQATDAGAPPVSAPAPAQPEPLHVTVSFGHDPLKATRQTILSQVHEAARVGAAGSLALEYARGALAHELLSSTTEDADTADAAVQSRDRQLACLAATPSARAGDIVVKLAVLMREMVASGNEDTTTTAAFALAAGALADLIILSDHPITLPARVTEPVGDAASIAYWRQRAAGFTAATERT